MMAFLYRFIYLEYSSSQVLLLLYSMFTQISEATDIVFAEMLKKRKSIFNLEVRHLV